VNHNQYLYNESQPVFTINIINHNLLSIHNQHLQWITTSIMNYNLLGIYNQHLQWITTSIYNQYNTSQFTQYSQSAFTIYLVFTFKKMNYKFLLLSFISYKRWVVALVDKPDMSMLYSAQYDYLVRCFYKLNMIYILLNILKG